VGVIRIFIVDKATALCAAMTGIFSAEGDIAVVGTAVSAESALSRLKGCDVVLVTAELPFNETLEITRAAAEQEPAVPVVVMDWDESQAASYEYASARVSAYVRQDDSVEELLEKMRAVHQANGALGRNADMPRVPAMEP
jgi:two-component system chemotaxis response regulator CheB